LKKYLLQCFQKTAVKLPYLSEVEISFDKPRIESHGDLSTNAAMLCAKKLKKNPREIANEIIQHLDINKDAVEKVEIAGAGFINFFFNQSFLSNVINEVLEGKESYGRSKKYFGKRANVEFVSANPTGPLTVGHGRGAVCGDTIANMLEWIGYKVDREYYFNNAGRQMRVLGDSVRLRYLELLNEIIEFPSDYYQGEYIKDIAGILYKENNDKLINESAEGVFKEIAEKEIFSDIKRTLKRLSIVHNIFYNENTLYDEGKIERLLKKFEEKNLSYEKDGALWLKFTELGNEQDKVIVKSTGEPTYRLPDVAYHITKFERNYDLIVDIFGADHNATYPDVLASLRALGYDVDNVKTIIHQFVTIIQDGEVVKMSTRKANFITLDELIEETGADVVRYFFNMRSVTSHMNFDLSVAKKHSDENPVFYLQYAHARICSILRMVKEEEINISTENLKLLITSEEQNIMKKLWLFEDEVLFAALSFEPNRICAYLEELAALFHRFYNLHRIIGSEIKLAEARIALITAVQIVLKNGLTILGLDAPERM
jgi:arginyl-tRNA synthetase